MQVTKETVIDYAVSDLEEIINTWCQKHSNQCSGGEMRGTRGDDIEWFVRSTINTIGKILKKDVVAKKGVEDRKELKLETPEKDITNDHQVDVHVYVNGVFSAVIECKSYLDKCFYVRACDDFRLFKRFDYHVKSYVFAMENCIADDKKIFTDHVFDHVCDDIFYMVEGKRTPTKPMYDEAYRKPVNRQMMGRFIDLVYDLCGSA